MVITSKQVLFYFYRKSQREKLEVHTSEPSEKMLSEAVVLFFQRPLQIIPKSGVVKSEEPTTKQHAYASFSRVYHSFHQELKSVSSSLESRPCMSNTSHNHHVRFPSSGPLAITFHLGTQLSHRESTFFCRDGGRMERQALEEGKPK